MSGRLARPWIVLGAVLLAGCSAPTLPFTSKAAATLDGGHSISMAAYDERLKLYRSLHDKQAAGQAGSVPGLDTPAGHADLLKLEDRAIKDLVDEELMREEAARRHLVVTDSDVDAQVTVARKLFPTEAAFQTGLKGYGYTLDQLREQLRGRLVEVKVENAKATERMQSAQKALAGGDFASVVKTWGDFQGTAGDGITTLTPAQLGQLDPEVKPALDALQPGQTSDKPAHGQRGLYIFKVLSRDDAGVKVDILYVFGPDAEHYRATDRPAWFDTFVTALEKSAHVKYNVGSQAGH